MKSTTSHRKSFVSIRPQQIKVTLWGFSSPHENVCLSGAHRLDHDKFIRARERYHRTDQQKVFVFFGEAGGERRRRRESWMYPQSYFEGKGIALVVGWRSFFFSRNVCELGQVIIAYQSVPGQLLFLFSFFSGASTHVWLASSEDIRLLREKGEEETDRAG